MERKWKQTRAKKGQNRRMQTNNMQILVNERTLEHVGTIFSKHSGTEFQSGLYEV